MPKVFMIVHGFVQGVGYRSYVKGIAEKYKVKGLVKNAKDGSVHIIAEADQKNLDKFMREIHIDTKYGVRVFGVEKFFEKEKGFPIEMRYDSKKFISESNGGD